MKQSVCVVAAAWVLLSGCGGKKRASLPAAARLGATETGVASWYGHPYHGRHAANGEIYDMEKMTAAHRTLPFGTWVRVTNLENNKTVDVRIIDRGPFVGGRIVDLSHAAAVSIDMIGPGTAKVRAFTDRRNAERVQSSLERVYGHATIVMRDGRPVQWRVLVGREETEEGAAALAERIRADPAAQAGSAFVVRIDNETGSDSL